MSLPGLSNQNGPQGIPTEKPRSDVYTVMVLIALLAVGAAIALLCIARISPRSALPTVTWPR